MSVKSIFGWGSLRIYNSTTTVQFIYAVHKLSFKRTNFRQTAITGRLHQTAPTFRPYIQCQVAICSAEDTERAVTLIGMINGANSDPIYVQPQYNNVSNTDNNTYEVFLDSDIDFEHIADSQVGQNFKITFIGKNQVLLPTNTSNAQNYNMVDIDGTYFLDQTGFKLIITI